MKHRLLYVTLIGAALLVAGCTPTCKGDSCSRPQSGGRHKCASNPAQPENVRTIRQCRWNDERPRNPGR